MHPQSRRRPAVMPRAMAFALLLPAIVAIGMQEASAGTCASTPAGLIGRWPGDGSPEDVAHGRNGSLLGNTTYVGGEVGQAFSFDGSGDAVTVPDHRDWTLRGDFTIDTWVNFSGYSSVAQALITQDEGAGTTNKWMFWYTESDQLAFEFGTGGGGYSPVSVPWTPSLGQWYHVAVTRSASTYTLYLDGASVDTGTESATIADAAAPLTLGWGETDWYFNGMLDEPEIYHRALSGTEIDAIHDQGPTARCAITRSTLSLDAPSKAFPDSTIEVTGQLSLSGGAAVDDRPIGLFRSVDEGPWTEIGDLSTDELGAFSHEDTPPKGTVTYLATFAGATDVSAENAWTKVVVAKANSILTLSLSRAKVKLGDQVTVTAHLEGGATNRSVTIYAVPKGGSKQALRKDPVNRDGNLSVVTSPTRETTYYAVYNGDAKWNADTSSSKVVEVEPRWAVKVIGGYATQNGFRLYHYSDACGPGDDTGCPAAAFVLSPNHAGQQVIFQGKYCHNGQCVSDSGSYRLNDQSKVGVYIYYGDRSIIGWTLSFRFRFAGDADHLPSTSAWAKTKVTA